MLLWGWLGKSEIIGYRLELLPRAEATVHRQNFFLRETPALILRSFN